MKVWVVIFVSVFVARMIQRLLGIRTTSTVIKSQSMVEMINNCLNGAVGAIGMIAFIKWWQ